MKHLLTIGLIWFVVLNDGKLSEDHQQPLTDSVSVKPIQDKRARTMEKLQRTEEEWKQILTPFEYHVLREKGTERAFSGEYVYTSEAGMYLCKGCDAPLYSSETKYDSHCGWPSFYDAVDSNAIVLTPDYSYGMVRTELTCARCGSHLGHIFDDGPEPTGVRHCINSVSLSFQPASK